MGMDVVVVVVGRLVVVVVLLRNLALWQKNLRINCITKS